jgi:hypothetical protein
MRFYHPPARGIIIVAQRKLPDAMEMFRQDNDGIEGERMVVVDLTERFAQVFAMPDERIVALTFGQVYGKEITATDYV